MKQTPFTALHKKLGAKMVPFAGYEMPVEYSGILEEHLNVCRAVGIFDVSHMGEFLVKGKQALSFLQNSVSNDVSLLEDGQVQYACLPNDQGGIVDDLLVYRLSSETYLLVVNASNIEKDWAWLNRHPENGVELENMSDRTAQLAVQGPKAAELLQRLTSTDLSVVPYYHFVYGSIAGVPNVLISNTGYTGAGGFELYFPPEQGIRIWQALFEAGADLEVKPAGLGARDTLRLEMGYCLYGHEIDDATSPIEAGLGWVTKFTPDKAFPARLLLEKQLAEGVQRRRVGLMMQEKGIPREGYAIKDDTGRVVGRVTSGNISPVLKVGIAMGYVETALSKPGTPLWVDVRGRQLAAKVVKMPFRSFAG
jgi:aminomethyltransferase